MALLLEFWHTSIKVDGFIAVKRKVGLLRAHMAPGASWWPESRRVRGRKSIASPRRMAHMAPSRAPPPLGRCLGGAWEVPGRCLGVAWEVPGRCLGGPWVVAVVVVVVVVVVVTS